MRTVIVIPARLEAQRLPQKPLAILGEVPLIVQVARQAMKSRRAKGVYVATDSREIYAAVAGCGHAVVMTRPEHLCGTDRVAEVMERLDADAVINLQGDEPFVNPADLDALIEALETGDTDMVTLKTPLHSQAELLDPNTVKVVTRDDGVALYFSRAPIPYDREEAHAAPGTYKHIGVYGYRREALFRLSRAPVHGLEMRERLEQLRALAMGLTIRVLRVQDPDSPCRGIDTHEDLKWARERVERLGEAAFPEA